MNSDCNNILHECYNFSSNEYIDVDLYQILRMLIIYKTFSGKLKIIYC